MKLVLNFGSTGTKFQIDLIDSWSFTNSRIYWKIIALKPLSVQFRFREKEMHVKVKASGIGNWNLQGNHPGEAYWNSQSHSRQNFPQKSTTNNLAFFLQIIYAGAADVISSSNRIGSCISSGFEPISTGDDLGLGAQ